MGSKFIQKTLNKFKGKNKFMAIVKNNNKESLNFFLKNKFKKKQNKRYLTQKQISSTNFSYFELNQKWITLNYLINVIILPSEGWSELLTRNNK